ncbi:MAG: hypothetical protein AAGF20_07160, partial [Pseudomonadota bacterium]
MSSYGSWSVKGIDDKARAVAKERARLEGVTLGDYINGLLLAGHSEAGPRDTVSAPKRTEIDIETTDETDAALDRLARRIEAVETRSTLAITGIDQSVLGLVARLENTEGASSAMAAEVERMVDDLRHTQETLQGRIQGLETDETVTQTLESLKALEEALGKLAAHVYEEANLTQDETAAIKGRMEAGFESLTDRMDSVDTKVETTLSEAAARVEAVVRDAETRAEGTSRHLSERFSAIETGVAAKLAKVDDVTNRVGSLETMVSKAIDRVDTSARRLDQREAILSQTIGEAQALQHADKTATDQRLAAMETDMSGAITSMEGTLVHIQERLNQAETTTDGALEALEQSFASLDKRLGDVAEAADPSRTEALKDDLAHKFAALAQDLRASVEESRRELANQIEQAATGANPELMGRLESSIGSLKTRLAKTEERSARSAGAVSDQVNRIATALDQRLRDVETRRGEALEARLGAIEAREERVVNEVGTQIEALAARLESQVKDSEHRSAAAIDQVGQQVSGAMQRLQARQDSLSETLSGQISAVNQRQDARLSKALSNISDRMAQMQQQTAGAVSPVQKAIAALAARLEDLEDFNAPPNAEDPVDKALPDMPVLAAEVAPLEEADLNDPFEDPAFETPEPQPSFEGGHGVSAEPASSTEEAFVPGVPNMAEAHPAQDDIAATSDPDVEPFDVTLDDWALPDDEISHGETPVEAAPVHDYRADL